MMSELIFLLIVSFMTYLAGHGIGMNDTKIKIIADQRICIQQESNEIKHEDCWKLVKQ